MSRLELMQTGPNLYMAHQSSSSNHAFYLAASPDSVNWTEKQIVPTIEIGSSPALAVFNGHLYMAYQANDSGHEFQLAVSNDAVTWSDSPIQNLTSPGQNITIGSSPALAVFKGSLYMAYQANDSKHQFRLASSSDAWNWADNPIPDIYIGSSPALAVFNDTLYMAYQGNDSNRQFYLASSPDGVTWTEKPINNITIGSSPALAVFNGVLYMAHQSNDPSSTFWIASSPDGVNWTEQNIKNITIGTSPALAVFNNTLYMAHTPAGSSGSFYLATSYDGLNWTDTPHSGILMGSSPALAAFQSTANISDLRNPSSASTSLHLSGQSYVVLPDLSQLANGTGLTMEAWIYPSLANASAPIFSVTGINGSESAMFTLYLTNGIPTAYVNQSSASSDSPVDANSWVHLAMTYDQTTQLLALYVNGIEVDAQPAPDLPVCTDYSGSLGLEMGNSAQIFQGGVGRVALWSVARSASEILADCVNSGVIDPVAETNLKLFVDFSLLPVADQSGYGTTLEYMSGAQLAVLKPGLVLDGVSWVDVGGGTQLDLSGTRSFTIDGWFNATRYGTAQTGTLVSRAQTDAIEYLIDYTSTGSETGTLRFTRGKSSVHSAPLPCNFWYHFAASYDSANSALYLYVNGNLQSSLIVTDEAPVVNSQTLLGASEAIGKTGNFFRGMIQNTRFWSVALSQAEIREWLFSQPITDDTLLGGFDFSVDPPVDTTGISATSGTSTIALHGNAAVRTEITHLDPASTAASIGSITAVDATYQEETPEELVPAPPAETSLQKIPVGKFEVSDLLSDGSREQSWNAIEAALPVGMSEKRRVRLRQTFDANFAEAQRQITANPRLVDGITQSVENGMVRLTYYTPEGDLLFYEGAASAISECQLWWIQFTWVLVSGFVSTVFLIKFNQSIVSAIASRVYNLMVSNLRVLTAMNNLISVFATGAVVTTIAMGGLQVLGALYAAGLLWSVFMLLLSAIGWWAIASIITRIITWISGTAIAAASTIASIIVWAAALILCLSRYPSSCSTPGSTADAE